MNIDGTEYVQYTVLFLCKKHRVHSIISMQETQRTAVATGYGHIVDTVL